MKTRLLTVCLLFACLASAVYAEAAAGKPTSSVATAPADFDPFKETKAQYDARVQWFRDAKFGIFIHWNPSCLTGGEISFARDEYGPEKYDQLYKQFKAENFDAKAWVKLWEKAGIRYSVIVPKHHDGFCMWDTKTQDYNVMNTPFGKDFIGEMAKAHKGSKVTFGLYYSIADVWNKTYNRAAGTDLTEYIEKYMKPHLRELLTNYGPVGCVWWDGPNDSWTHAYAREMYGFQRRIQPATMHGNRIEPVTKRTTPTKYCHWVAEIFDAPDAVGDFQAREQEIGRFCNVVAWDSCIPLSPSGALFGWGWIPPANPRPVSHVLSWLIHCIGRDGNLLLGIGPRPDGTIDPRHAAALQEIGAWIKPRAEAIYGTRGGPYMPTAQYVSTYRGNKVYLFITGWDGETIDVWAAGQMLRTITAWNGDSLVIPALSEGFKSARLIPGGMVTVEAANNTWTIRLPKEHRQPLATIVELTLKRDVDPTAIDPTPVSVGTTVRVSGEWKGREQELSKEHVADNNFSTIWAAPEGTRSGWVELDLGKKTGVSQAVLDDMPFGRTRKFTLRAKVREAATWEADQKGEWKVLATGTTMGSQKNIRFEKINAQVFRLDIEDATDVPVIAEFQLF